MPVFEAKIKAIGKPAWCKKVANAVAEAIPQNEKRKIEDVEESCDFCENQLKGFSEFFHFVLLQLTDKHLYAAHPDLTGEPPRPNVAYKCLLS